MLPTNSKRYRHAIVLFVIKDKNVDVKNIKYQELMQKATLDQMTGLYNHTNTFDKIEKYTKNEGYGLTHALFMIDIDNFKMVNDRLGHAYGDKTIIEVGNTIKNSFRKNDIVGRIGGDEFMILMKDINFEKANAKAQELVDLLQVIAHNEADTVNTSCSVGVFVFKANGSSIEQLYLKTDALLYKSKQSGRNTFTIDTDKDENLLSIEENKTNVDETKGSVLKMKTLFDNLQAGVFMVDVFKDKKTDVFANNGCDAYFAGNPNYLGHTSDGFFNVVYKDDIAALNHFLENDSKKEGRRTFTLRVWKTKDELTWLNLSTKCLENNSERARLLCIVFDVTHLKMAEEKVADENRAMDFALNNVNACIWEYNIKENKTHYRGNVQFKYGLSDELNDPIETLIKRGTIANRSIDDYRLMYDSIESGQDSLTKDIYFVSIDGETIKITITLNAVKDPSGKLVSIVGFGFRSK
jgi:diguanylate cyclase (GGDEF)-like protein